MRFLRQALWLRFHIWTVSFLAILTIANVSTHLRPYESSSSLAAAGPSLQLAENSNGATARTPASTTLNSVFSNSGTETDRTAVNARALKLAALGCESHLQLSVSNEVRQLRIKFEACPTAPTSRDDVVQVSNATNGFQATVFSTDSLAASKADSAESIPKAETEMPGVFVTPESKTAKLEKEKNKVPARRPANDRASEPASTDYISLADGINEIRIQRSDREQVLQILRK